MINFHLISSVTGRPENVTTKDERERKLLPMEQLSEETLTVSAQLG